MLLYVHVPFCRAKCAYCAFHSQAFDMEACERYLEVLGAEMELMRRRFGAKRLESLYVGGGTPSLLPPWGVERLMQTVDRAFKLDTRAEFSLEANPDSADFETLKLWHGMGANRISLGVQSFDDADLARLGRAHTAAQAETAYTAAWRAGFDNISLDLIWGLPGQRVSGWLRSLRAAIGLGPQHMSCYNLTLEAGTPLARAAESGGLAFAPDEDQARMFVYGSELLEGKGYLQYEISNYARMGFACRHNQGYWDGADYLGLGPSAVSTVAGRRWENPRHMDEWEAAVRSGRLGNEAESEEITEAIRARELVMLGLRTAKGLQLGRYRKLTGRDFLADNKGVLTALRNRDLIRISGGFVRLTRQGMLVSNAILAHLDVPDGAETPPRLGGASGSGVEGGPPGALSC
jgi:oxygen-independent coproporphyrinogen-3 oxidase